MYNNRKQTNKNIELMVVFQLCCSSFVHKNKFKSYMTSCITTNITNTNKFQAFIFGTKKKFIPPSAAFQLPPCQLINQTVSLEKEGCPSCHPVETTICSGHCITKVMWFMSVKERNINQKEFQSCKNQEIKTNHLEAQNQKIIQSGLI